jgi:hypothetical protein
VIEFVAHRVAPVLVGERQAARCKSEERGRTIAPEFLAKAPKRMYRGRQNSRDEEDEQREDEDAGYDAPRSSERRRAGAVRVGSFAAAYSKPRWVSRYRWRGGRPEGESVSQRDSSNSRSESRTRIG